MQKVYFDNAATTAIDPEVIGLMTVAMQDIYGNPSSTHQTGRKAKSLLETSRKNIASVLNCSSSEIIFTSGGSEADNLILNNAVHHLGVERIISSKIEHPAVLNTIKYLVKTNYIEVEFIKPDHNGSIDLSQLKTILNRSNKKTLVSLMHVNNEIGNVLDLKEVSSICRQNNALFHSDTVQGIAHFKIDLKETPVDFMVASAHKFHGPKGVGFAYFKKGTGIEPMIYGGEQEKGARAGTENIHAIFGMSEALRIAVRNHEKDREYLKDLKFYFIQSLKSILPDIHFNGSPEDPGSAPHILNVRFPKEIPMMLFNLDLKGIAASGGSACQSGSNKGSHVLEEILDDKELKKTSVRFSFSRFNTKEEVDQVINVLSGMFN